MAGENPPALSPPARGKRSPETTTTTVEASAQRRATPETERARRRTMNCLYAELAALIPGLPARATKTRILEAAIERVGALRATAAELEAHRAVADGRRRAAAAAARTTTTDGAGAGVLASSVEASCFSVRLPAARRPGSVTRVLEAFHRNGAAVLAATVTTGTAGEAAVTVTTSAVAPAVVERIKADISSSLS